jgi:hypothetical protein
VDYQILQAELTSDPVPLGYAGLNDTQAAAKLNATNTGRTAARRAVTKNELLSAIVPSEWPSTALPQNQLLCIFSCDTVDASNTNVRALFGAIFPAGSATRTNLLAIGTVAISRGVELGIGQVTPVDVGRARAGVW